MQLDTYCPVLDDSIAAQRDTERQSWRSVMLATVDYLRTTRHGADTSDAIAHAIGSGPRNVGLAAGKHPRTLLTIEGAWPEEQELEGVENISKGRRTIIKLHPHLVR